MVDLRIKETLNTGVVGNRTYRVGVDAARLETAPTGPDNQFTSLPRAEAAAPETLVHTSPEIVIVAGC